MTLRPGHPSALNALTLALTITLLASTSPAQQPKVLAPHRPIAPKATSALALPAAVPGSMVGGPWIIDANFKSSIYLKNIVETSPVTVTPVLYLSNGAKYVLPNVTLDPAGSAIVDVNAALQAQGVASFATLSGYVELQYSWPWNPICAMIRDIDVAHSLIFTFGAQALAPASAQNSASAQAIEGLWWKQESNVTGFVALANTSTQPINAAVQVSDNRGAVLGTYTVTISPHGMKTINMQELQSATKTEGGIRVSYVGLQDALIINGGVEDQSVGYSAALHFASPSAPPVLPAGAQLVTAATSIAQLGLMIGPADPMMAFPAGTKFTPYSVLRNVSASPISVTPTLWWMQNGAAASAQLAQFQLAPYAAQSLDLISAMSTSGLKNFSGNVNLTFDTQGQSGLLLAAGSVDQTNTYVFEVASRGTAESAGKAIGYWSTANGDDTMVTIWNPADEAQDFVFRLIFSGGQYNLPMHLEARATRTFNVSEIIMSQLPDAQGNIIPAVAQQGTMRIVGSQADNQHILVSVDSGIYNVKKATCSGNNCVTCDGYTVNSTQANPFGVRVTGTNQLKWILTWDTGQQYDYTSVSGTIWSSNSTSVATVNIGLVSGVSVGSAQISSTNSSPPVYTLNFCSNGSLHCPVGQGAGGTSSGYVGPYKVEPISTIAQGPFPAGECPTGGSNPGYLRAVNNQVQDITGAGSPYSVLAADLITVGSRHDLGGGTSTGSAQTASDGSFYDNYSICSSACPGSTGETDALQNWTVNGVPLFHVNGVVYKCTSITIDGF